MPLTPLVSILMTSFNTSAYIGKAIQSVLDQTFRDWELLIADDCSTDDSRSIIEGFTDDRIKIFHNDKNLHYLRTRNKLLAHVRGKYVALLDSDDLYTPQKIQRQFDAFSHDPELGMCGTLVCYINKEGRAIMRKDQKPTDYDQIKDAIKEDSTFTGSSIMVKMEIMREFGGYRDFFSGLGFEDYDLTSRIVEKYKAINIPEPLYLYRQYPESTSRKDMLTSPFKIHGHWLIKHFILERAGGGIDSLDKNDMSFIHRFIAEKNKPYAEDPSLIYRELMWSYLHRMMMRQAAHHAWQAIKIGPLRWPNWKAAILFVLISLRLRKF